MSIVNDSHHQNQLLRVRLSKCRLEDVMENRNPSQKHSWQAQQPLNTDMHRHANDMHRHAQTRDFKNETTCTDTRNNLFFRVIGHSRRFAWSWGRRRSHQTWVVRSMSQHVKQVKNSVPQNMTNKTSITTVHMQTWSMTTCTYTHAFSRQQVCFPVRVHLLLWDKGSTPWRSRPLGAKDDVRFLTSSFQKTMSETSPFQKTMSWDIVIPKSPAILDEDSVFFTSIWIRGQSPTFQCWPIFDG